MAAAFVLTSAPVPASAQPAGQINARLTAARGAANGAGATVPPLLPVGQTAARHTSAQPVTYTVKSGDTLSAIAAHVYRDTKYWPVLYWANHGEIRYANQIGAGEVLAVPVKPAKIPSPPGVLAPAPPPTVTSAPAATAPDSTAQTGTAQAGTEQTNPGQSTTVSTAGDGSFRSCVIARESGGDSQVMNSSGHYGLYQFSASTWAAYGGNPADFGNASVAEQNQVFNNAIAAGGSSNWSAYDGC